jgi:excisionase family DNA binding protein
VDVSGSGARPMDQRTERVSEKLLLRPVEAAEAIGVSRSRAYELIGSGQIPSIRIGTSLRVPVEALREWIERELLERSK